jgi:NAD+ kinase
MLFDRTLVLDPAESIRLEVIGHRAASLVVDGRSLGTLEPGMAVVCRAGGADARLVTFNGRDFHDILKAKFGLADR